MADRRITQLAPLTDPAGNDLFVVVDVSEGDNADKNKQFSISTLHKTAPNGNSLFPAIGFRSDINLTGFYRSAANEIAVSANKSYIAKFTQSGFQVGSGTATAQLHLFSSDTTDQVIIENNSTSADTAPDVVLSRNSASPANGDSLGNIEFRGINNNSVYATYAQILAQIGDTTVDNEDGILQLITNSSGSLGSRLTIKGKRIGVNETSPDYPLHITESLTNTGLCIESEQNTVATGANLMLYHNRGGNVSSQDGDLLSAFSFDGRNDANTPEQLSYATLLASIVDATNGNESGRLVFQIEHNGSNVNAVQITGENIALAAKPILPTHTPSAADAAGTTGEVAWDQNYVYVCVATNTWKRSAISSW